MTVAVVALLDLVIFFVFPFECVYMSISLWLPKLYANATIMVINAKFKIVYADRDADHIIQTFPTALRFKDLTNNVPLETVSEGSTSSMGRKSIEITKETETVVHVDFLERIPAIVSSFLSPNQPRF